MASALDPKRRAQVIALHSIARTAELAGYSPAQVKRIWAEVSKAEAERMGAFQEDALSEADALARAKVDEHEPRVGELPLAEIEVLRQEMRELPNGQEPNWHTGAL